VYVDVVVIDHINHKHKVAGEWMKSNSNDIQKIWEYLEKSQ